MPNLPQPLVIRDWEQVTRDYLDVLLDFDRQGAHFPLVQWMDDEHSMVAIPSYIGGPRASEAVNYLAAVVSGSLVGIDMRNHHGQDWVALGGNFFNSEEGVYVNRLGREDGAFVLVRHFSECLVLPSQRSVSERPRPRSTGPLFSAQMARRLRRLGGKTDPPSLPNFDHTGFALSTMQPMESGWIEPEAAAGIAWLEYMAWVKYQDPRFLTAADWAIRALVERPDEQSPLYEVLLPYGALAAARMNAERGTDYNVSKLLNQCFDAHARPQARPGWGVISDQWHGQDVHGLVGSTTDGEGYAFAMNTYQWAGAIVPIARYDSRYARDIGKWMLNLTNASRLFYPNAHDKECQSSHAWSAANDPKAAIAYEGIRKWKRGAAVATADFRTTGGRVVQGSYASTHVRKESPAVPRSDRRECRRRRAAGTHLGIRAAAGGEALARRRCGAFRWGPSWELFRVLICQ